jgi:CubicO group peptidase (beta-lactamase class C family)
LKDGKLMLSRGYGHRDAARTQPVPADAPFRLASVTKPVTAAAIRQLIAQGKFHENTKVAEYLALPTPKDPRWADVTVGQLLAHRGGFDRSKAGDPMFQTDDIMKTLNLSSAPTPADVLKYMAGRPLQFDPDSKSAYSNFGYCILGRVIEKASGKPYIQYIQDDLLKPQRIEGFALGRTRPADRDPREPFYSDPFRGEDKLLPKGEKAVPMPDGGFHLEIMDSHGGLIAPATSTADFFAKFRIDGRPTDAKSPPEVHFGSLPGTFTVAARRPGGIAFAALFNQRSDASGRTYDAILESLSKVAAEIETWPVR